MTSDSTHPTTSQPEAETAVYLFDDWFDPIEACVRERVREFIQAMSRTSCDCEDCLTDLLRDLMHWADKARLNFADEFRRARFHYNVEAADEEAAG